MPVTVENVNRLIFATVTQHFSTGTKVNPRHHCSMVQFMKS